ncbi:MAG: helix-turn-helix domain-containing protein [Nitrospinota bacterium]
MAKAKKTNFDKHLERELKNPKFAKGFYEELEKTQLAIKIAEAREKRKMTQKQLAERVGTSQSVIARIENPNYDRFTIKTLRKIANALDANLEISLHSR